MICVKFPLFLRITPTHRLITLLVLQFSATMLAAEHGFVPPNRLFNRTLTVKNGRHLRVAHARTAHTFLSKHT